MTTNGVSRGHLVLFFNSAGFLGYVKLGNVSKTVLLFSVQFCFCQFMPKQQAASGSSQCIDIFSKLK